MININYRHKTVKYILPLLAIGGYIVLIAFPSLVAGGVQRGIKLCTELLIPSILPFSVCTNILLGCDFEAITAKLFKTPFTKLFGLNPNLAFPFIIGLISGYPQGAVAVLDIYEKGGCTRAEAEHALCFCNNTGIGFLFGAVPVIFKNNALGIQLFILQLVSSLAFALIFKPRNKASLPKIKNESKEPSLSLISSSAIKAMKTVAVISVFVIIFAAISELITGFCKFYGISEEITDIILSFFELSNTASRTAASASVLKIPTLAFALCFSGICVHLQIYACLKGKLAMGKFFLSKLFQGIFSFLIVLFLKIT